MADLARYAGETLGETNQACLLQNDGTRDIGENPGKAFLVTEVLEGMVEVYYLAKLDREPILLSQDRRSG